MVTFDYLLTHLCTDEYNPRMRLLKVSHRSVHIIRQRKTPAEPHDIHSQQPEPTSLRYSNWKLMRISCHILLLYLPEFYQKSNQSCYHLCFCYLSEGSDRHRCLLIMYDCVDCIQLDKVWYSWIQKYWKKKRKNVLRWTRIQACLTVTHPTATRSQRCRTSLFD